MAEAGCLSSKLSNLNLGNFGNDTERLSAFWNRATVEIKFSVEKTRLDAVWRCTKKPNYGMQNLDKVLEERCSMKLGLVGPLFDGYFREIGKAFVAKLGRSRKSGLMPPIRLFIPHAIFRHLCSMSVGYGGTSSSDESKRQIKLTIDRFVTAPKIFSPVRFGGENFLRKRHYRRVVEN